MFKMASIEGDRENLKRLKEGVAQMFQADAAAAAAMNLASARESMRLGSSDIDFSWVTDLETRYTIYLYKNQTKINFSQV